MLGFNLREIFLNDSNCICISYFRSTQQCGIISKIRHWTDTFDSIQPVGLNVDFDVSIMLKMGFK